VNTGVILDTREHGPSRSAGAVVNKHSVELTRPIISCWKTRKTYYCGLSTATVTELICMSIWTCFMGWCSVRCFCHSKWCETGMCLSPFWLLYTFMT